MQRVIRWPSSVLAAGLFVLLGSLGSFPLCAQQTAAPLAGTVLDQAGKTVQGATVTIKNDSGAVAQTLTTDAEGHFSAPDLAAGKYALETTAPGFALNSRLGVAVPSPESADLDYAECRFDLPVGHGSGTDTAGRGIRPHGQFARCHCRDHRYQ